MSWLLPALEPHFDAALRDVRAQSVAARVAAARRLGRPDPEREHEARHGLRALLADNAAPTRAAALDSLATIGTEDDHELAAALLDDEDPLVRELAVIAVSHIEHPARDSVLCGALEHRSPEVRFQALQACTASMPSEIVGHALALSRDEDAKVREAAIRALGSVGAQEGPGHARLVALLSDPHPTVRWEAALALAPNQDCAALNELIPSLQQNDRLLDTLEALGHYRAKTARSAVEDVAASLLKSPLVVAAAARTLLNMGEREAAIPPLRRALRALRSDGRNLVLQTVAEWHLTDLGPEIQRLARRPRGVDPELLVSSLLALVDEWPGARHTLDQLAHRRGVIGQAARAALTDPAPNGSGPSIS